MRQQQNKTIPYISYESSRTFQILSRIQLMIVRGLQAKGPVNASLSDHFFAKFRRGSVECKAAQRAFAESMAAYSLVCYFLQIKVGPFVMQHTVSHMRACPDCHTGHQAQQSSLADCQS